MRILKEQIEHDCYLDITITEKDIQLLKNYNFVLGVFELENKLVNLSIRKNEDEEEDAID